MLLESDARAALAALVFNDAGPQPNTSPHGKHPSCVEQAATPSPHRRAGATRSTRYLSSSSASSLAFAA